jgi:hypothetical protein
MTHNVCYGAAPLHLQLLAPLEPAAAAAAAGMGWQRGWQRGPNGE